MGIFAALKDLVSGPGVIDAAKDAYVAHQEVQVNKDTNQANAASQNLSADESWEDEEIKNSGWKDEYVLLLLSIPLILAFVPYTAQAVLDGFKVLEQTPQWYRWLTMLVFTAIYGIRIWRR